MTAMVVPLSGDKCRLVRLLVHGDSGSLDCCLASLKSDVPLVVMAGTGGAADVLVNTLRNQSGTEIHTQKTVTEYARSIQKFE